jgi:hypothetical protein
MLTVRHVDDAGSVLVRDNFVLAFFCCRDFKTMADAVRGVFDEWLAVIPADALQWTLIGSSASEIKPIAKTSLDRCRDQMDPAKAAKRPLSAFVVFGPEVDNPSYRFNLDGAAKVESNKAVDAETNVVEMRFPAEFVASFGADAFVELAVKFAAQLPYDSGYGSLALSPARQGNARAMFDVLGPLALRHPGYDVYQNSSSRIGLGRRSRGARWLTFLGAAPLKKLGGAKALRALLDPSVEVIDAGGGVALRAGRKPEPGDVNRKKDLPALRAVAKAIEAVTRFGDNFMIKFFQGDADKRDRWERRFLD